MFEFYNRQNVGIPKIQPDEWFNGGVCDWAKLVPAVLVYYQNILFIYV